MANAKQLSDNQISVLRVAAKGERLPTRRRGTTINSLVRRGLLDERSRITPAGRQALFEATGENTAPKENPCP